MAETIIDKCIYDILPQYFLDYSKEVIQNRALSNAYDGLKPVHRKILYSMHGLGFTSSGAFRKSVKTVGECLSLYHPHGDQSVYDAMVNLSQDFNMRYPLITFQGNNGSIDGDPAAAMRYTESKLSPFGELMLQDVDRISETQKNYDGSIDEPIVLSTYFPNLILNGTAGIAVGLASSFAPHYSKDVYEAIEYIVRCMLDDVQIDQNQIIKYIKAPDFPTGATIINGSEMPSMYKTGRGRVILRSKYTIQDDSIVYTEIPYRANPASIVAKIASLNLSEIKDVRDESNNKEGIRIVVELKKNTNSDWIVNKLFKETDLQSSFSVNMVAILNDKPYANLSIDKILQYFIQNASKAYLKELKLDLEELNKKLSNVKTMLKAIDLIDEIINIVRNSDAPIDKLQSELGFLEDEAKYIYELKIKTLSKANDAALNAQKNSIEDEINHISNIISSKEIFLSTLLTRFENIKNSKMFAKDCRRTEITDIDGNSDIRDFIKQETVIVSYTNKGVIKAIRPEEYKTTSRGSVGTKSSKLKEDECITHILTMNTHDDIYCFSSTGKCYSIPVYKIPIATKISLGKYISNLISLNEDETIVDIIGISRDERKNKTIVFTTEKGYIKRLRFDDIGNRVSTVGTRVISFVDEDKLKSAILCDASDEIIIFTSSARGLKFNIDDESKPVRPTGKNARGVRAINLTNEVVIGAAKIESDKDLVLISSLGFGKRIKLKDIPTKKRSQTPVVLLKNIKKTGNIIGGLASSETDELLIATKHSLVVRIKASNVRMVGRNASGVKCVNLKDNDFVVSISKIEKSEIEEDDE